MQGSFFEEYKYIIVPFLCGLEYNYLSLFMI